MMMMVMMMIMMVVVMVVVVVVVVQVQKMKESKIVPPLPDELTLKMKKMIVVTMVQAQVKIHQRQ